MSACHWRSVLAEALSDETLFDEGVEATRNACIGGASIASAAIVAAAYYDNPLSGMPALRQCLQRLADNPKDLDRWLQIRVKTPPDSPEDDSPPPGFGLLSAMQAARVEYFAAKLHQQCDCSTGSPRLQFFLDNRSALRTMLGPLNSTGLAALCFADHSVDTDEAERQFLLWKIAPAIEQAQRARASGLAKFPYFSVDLTYEGQRPQAGPVSLHEVARAVGLE